MGLLIFGGDVVVPGAVIPNGAVLIEQKTIVAVGPAAQLRGAAGIDRRIDVGGRIIAPGFIDLQLNGAAGRMLTTEPSPETVRALAAVLPQFGCTAFLPTVITAPLEQMLAASAAVAGAMAGSADGARILGTHLEGPFINPERSGAHPKAFILRPSRETLARFWEHSGRSVRLLTLASEQPAAPAVIAAARRLGIMVAIGHSNADLTQVNAAVRNGATLATHLFNAMGPLGSREPGTVGGVLANDQIAASVIADGVHVHPAALQIAVRTKGVERIILITDAMPPLGSAMTTFELDGVRIEARDGACYRPDGVLAGSTLSMDRAVRNMHRLVGVPLLDAIAMASLNPARVIGLADRKGSLEAGKDADLVVCDPEVNVWLTLVEGQIHYRADDCPA